MANISRVGFELRGTSSLLMHADNVEAAGTLERWRKDPQNKNRSVAGDDRSPSWTWQTYLYPDSSMSYVSMPSENIMCALRAAGTHLILKRQKTFKEITQSGLLMDSIDCDFFTEVGTGKKGEGHQVAMSDIEALRDMEFSAQAEAVRDLGFSLFVKRARVGQSKHVRVRPKFDDWAVRGTLRVMKPEITPAILQQLFEIAGSIGLCDWRPGCRTPGPYGMFSAETWVLDGAGKKAA